MSKIIKKVLLVLMTLILAMPVLPVTEAQAASKKPTFSKNVTLVHYAKDKARNKGAWEIRTDDEYGRDTIKVSKLKSSNSKVLKVHIANKGGKQEAIGIQSKKAGTATVSFTATVNGKKHNFKCKVKVVKYQNPFKSFKVGSKNYASKYKNTSFSAWADNKNWPAPSKDKIKGKLNIVPNKNWKIKSIRVANAYETGWKKIKNKSKIDMSKKNSRTLQIEMRNSKTGVEHEFLVAR